MSKTKLEEPLLMEFPCDFNDKEVCRKARNDAIESAREALEPGTVFEIRAKLYPNEHNPVPWPMSVETQARNWALAWIWYPPQPEEYKDCADIHIPAEPLVNYDYDKGEIRGRDRYVLLARIAA